MRPLWCRVTFAGRRPVQLPYPCRVCYGRIDLHPIVVEFRSQGFQAAADYAPIIRWKVDWKEQMPTIAAVRDDRRGPTIRLKVDGDLSDPGKCQFMFLVSGTDASQADWIGVNQQPSPAEDLMVLGGFALVEPHAPVVETREYIRLARVRNDVPSIRELYAARGLDQLLGVIEVSAEGEIEAAGQGFPGLQDPQFSNMIRTNAEDFECRAHCLRIWFKG